MCELDVEFLGNEKNTVRLKSRIAKNFITKFSKVLIDSYDQMRGEVSVKLNF